MRKENKNIEKEVNKTLQSLDQWNRPDSNPYFLSKLQEKMHGEKQVPAIGIFTWLQPAMFALLIVFNVFTLYSFISQPEEVSEELSAYFEELELNDSTEDYLSLEQ